MPQPIEATVTLPAKLSTIRVDDGAVIDMRTGKALTAEEVEQHYVSFPEWWHANVQLLCNRGVYYYNAPMYLAEALLSGFMREPHQ